MAQRLTFSGEQYWNTTDRNGEPGAKLYSYEAGTTTRKTTWFDADEATPHTNPIIADAEGIFPPIYGDGSYFIEIYNQDDTDLIYQEDNISSDPDGDDNSTIERIPDLDTAKGRDLSAFDVVYVESLTPNWQDTIPGPNNGFYAHSDGTTGTPSTGDENQFFDAAGNGWTRDTNQRLDESIEQSVTDNSAEITNLKVIGKEIDGADTSSSNGDDVIVTAGLCLDSTFTTFIDVPATTADIKNRITAGGNLAGEASPTADSTYYVFVVSEADGSNPRIGIDLDINATDALVDWSTQTGNTYTLYRLIGFALTDATPDIIGFNHTGNEWMYNEILEAGNIAPVPNTNAQLIDCGVPTGVEVNPLCVMRLIDSSPAGQVLCLVTSISQTDLAPTASNFTMEVSSASKASDEIPLQFVKTDTNGQVRFRNGLAPGSVGVSTIAYGWRYER